MAGISFSSFTKDFSAKMSMKAHEQTVPRDLIDMDEVAIERSNVTGADAYVPLSFLFRI